MDGWGDAPSEAEARTWLAMDLLAPVHDLRALEVVPGPGGEAPPAVQALTEGLLGEHRPELTDAALAGLVDLERALVVGAALEVARGLVAPEVLIVVECALVDEACRLSLLPLVNAAADLLLELERDAVHDEVAQDEAAQDEVAQDEAAQDEVGDPLPLQRDLVSGRGSSRRDRRRGPARRRVAAARAGRGGGRSRGPPRPGAVVDGGRRAHADRPGGWGQGPRSQSSR